MNDSFDPMRKRQGDMIGAFLDSQAADGWVPKHYELTGGKILVISRGDQVFSLSVLESLLRYQKDHVLFPKGRNLDRADCIDVAIKFQNAFERTPAFSHLQADYFVDRLHAGKITGDRLSFFREKGFSLHQMNMIVFAPEHGTHMYAAVDLTAHYNMDIEQGTNDIFMIIADSREHLLDALRNITHARWALVHE